MCVLQEIDEYITQAKDRSYETMMRFGKRGLNIAATAAVTAATKVKSLNKCINLFKRNLTGHKLLISSV